MKKNLLVLVLLILSGCASVGTKTVDEAPKIDRLSEAELLQIMPSPVSQLSFESLLALSKEGKPADEVIAKLKETDTSYDLTPSQMIDLNKQGVEVKVLDYLHQSRLDALQNNVAKVVRENEKKHTDEITGLKRILLNQSFMNDPFCRGPFMRGYPFGIGGRFIW